MIYEYLRLAFCAVIGFAAGLALAAFYFGRLRE